MNAAVADRNSNSATRAHAVYAQDADTQTCFQFGGKVEVLERPDEPSSGLAWGIGELFCTSVS